MNYCFSFTASYSFFLLIYRRRTGANKFTSTAFTSCRPNTRVAKFDNIIFKEAPVKVYSRNDIWYMDVPLCGSLHLKKSRFNIKLLTICAFCLLFCCGIQIAVHVEIVITIFNRHRQLGMTKRAGNIGDLCINSNPSHDRK